MTGYVHAGDCPHYDPPEALSGLGQVNGSAIKENIKLGVTTLSLDFALKQGRSRPASDAPPIPHDSVRSDGTKLTLRSTLHYLYEQARLTTWAPKMEGKRNWFIVRRELLAAAEDKVAKGRPLGEHLYVPESFRLEQESEIKSRRLAKLSRLAESPANRMLLIAEVSYFEATRFGQKVVAKHIPDIGFMLTEYLNKKIMSRFKNELLIWDQIKTSHLMIAATFSRTVQGLHVVESAALMNVTEQWVPFDNLMELELLEKLTRQQRRFTKSLRYNLAPEKPLTTVVLQDSKNGPTAMYVVIDDATDKYADEAAKLNAEVKMPTWQWNALTETMPSLPPLKAIYESQPAV